MIRNSASISVPSIAWLHVSDWHQKADAASFNRKVVREALIRDVANRQEIADDLARLDFVIFSGDLTHGGGKDEFAAADEEFIKPLRRAAGRNVPVFFVPGNHDIQRPKLAGIPPALRDKINAHRDENEQALEDFLYEKTTLPHFLEPLENFHKFARRYNNNYSDSALHASHIVKRNGHRIAVLCLNTAWHSARFHIAAAGAPPSASTPAPPERVWDYGILRVTEKQLRDAIRDAGKFDIGIVVMHHPLYWLSEAEQGKFEHLLYQHCHLVLHGHEHRPRLNRVRGSYGELVIVPAGASYQRRIASDPRQTNAYNFCSLDPIKLEGRVFHRVWSEETTDWVADTRYLHRGVAKFHVGKKAGKSSNAADSLLDEVKAKYFDFTKKRLASLTEIEVEHKPHRIDDEWFVLVGVKYSFHFPPGDAPDNFTVMTMAHPGILAHKNPKVRERAYRLVALQPFLKRRGRSGKSTKANQLVPARVIDKTFVIDPNTRVVEYAYEMLDSWQGSWLFRLNRFSEKVKVSIAKSDMHEYQHNLLGGFPGREPKRGLKDILVMEADELCFPYQGLLLEWFPKNAKLGGRLAGRPSR